MRFLSIPGLLLAATTAAFPQDPATGMSQTVRDRINFSNLSIPATGTLFGFDGTPGQVVGDAYLDSTWQAGNVKFYGRLTASTDSLAGVPVRLDLMAPAVEIRAGARDIRIAKGPAVRYVDVNNRLGTSTRYVNVREYRGEADELSGFFEQVVTGRIDLLLHPVAYIRKSTYNPAMNVGTKDDEIRKRTDWYVAEGKRATRFIPGRKALLELMADRKEQIDAFLKRETPDLKSRAGLLTVVAYYNGLSNK